MNPQRERLDDAIDAVAARMTRLEENDALATRILASLPDRSPWSLHWWMPRLALTAMLAGAVSFVVLRTFDDGSARVLRTFDDRSAIVAVTFPVAAEDRTDVEPALIVRRTIVERPSNDRRTTDVSDFERSLSAIEVADALALAPLGPVSLPEDAPLTLEPLAIVDLPLSAESFSPRD